MPVHMAPPRDIDVDTTRQVRNETARYRILRRENAIVIVWRIVVVDVVPANVCCSHANGNRHSALGCMEFVRSQRRLEGGLACIYQGMVSIKTCDSCQK